MDKLNSWVKVMSLKVKKKKLFKGLDLSIFNPTLGKCNPACF